MSEKSSWKFDAQEFKTKTKERKAEAEKTAESYTYREITEELRQYIRVCIFASIVITVIVLISEKMSYQHPTLKDAIMYLVGFFFAALAVSNIKKHNLVIPMVDAGMFAVKMLFKALVSGFFAVAATLLGGGLFGIVMFVLGLIFYIALAAMALLGVALVWIGIAIYTFIYFLYCSYLAKVEKEKGYVPEELKTKIKSRAKTVCIALYAFMVIGGCAAQR